MSLCVASSYVIASIAIASCYTSQAALMMLACDMESYGKIPTHNIVMINIYTHSNYGIVFVILHTKLASLLMNFFARSNCKYPQKSINIGRLAQIKC